MLTQCIEQPGCILACIDDDGSNFLLSSDDSKIVALRVGEVTDAIGINYPSACANRAGYLRVGGFRAVANMVRGNACMQGICLLTSLSLPLTYQTWFGQACIETGLNSFYAISIPRV
ncbi:hypothetical protein TNCV_4234281 [Trichonephila clavipes]|nr:hypothetical protein TNCV_4234281 [Trichonephila clavipes]